METQRIKIFVSAYACEPYKGSEPGVGWHWVLEMAQYFELWVLTRKSNRKDIEEWLDTNRELAQLQHIHFNYYDPPAKLTFWKKKMRGVRLYYNLWQLGANKHIKHIMEDNNISVFHLLTYGNALWPISRYGQSKFFIWGPTGGLDIIEPEFTRNYSLKSRLIELIRRIAVRSLKINPGFISRCKKADLILCKTVAAYNCIPIQYRSKAHIFTDVASDINLEYDDERVIQKDTIDYITVGKLDAWRGFDLVIEAFSRAYEHNKKIRLKIIGKGTEHKRLNNFINNLGLSSVISMTGEIPMEDYRNEMVSCDVVINACLKEGAVTNAFDCITYGKPFICVDTGGYTRYFSKEFALVLPRVGRIELVNLLTDSILKLTDPASRKELSQHIHAQSKTISWNVKGLEISNLFNKHLMNFN